MAQMGQHKQVCAYLGSFVKGFWHFYTVLIIFLLIAWYSNADSSPEILHAVWLYLRYKLLNVSAKYSDFVNTECHLWIVPDICSLTIIYEKQKS